jgi:hypothetical protein
MSNEKDSVPAEIENMDELWVSTNGDDGATRNAAIYSLKRLRQLCNASTDLNFTDEPTRQRIVTEIKRGKEKQKE